MAECRVAMGVAVGDYECDGWLDIVRQTIPTTANLYRNNGDGTFYDAVLQGGMGGNTRYLGGGGPMRLRQRWLA